MLTIVPTVGRVVWYQPGAGDLPRNGTDPLAAIVAAVMQPRNEGEPYTLVLSVLTRDGYPQARAGVLLIQEGQQAPKDGRPYCHWMPYQVGQAKKHEAT